MNGYERWCLDTLKQALESRRVVVISGARQCGKTTLARLAADSGSCDTLANSSGNEVQSYLKKAAKAGMGKSGQSTAADIRRDL